MSTPAREALDALIEQFSERSAAIRELVQNSLDAGAGSVELRIEQQGRKLRIHLVDDGHGMDRACIQDNLLTLFRSNKEDDQTKIGRFGVGFVSIFALEPELVVVDTGRDGLHHRVVFDAKQRFTLAQVDEPFEGTAVTLTLRSWGKPAGELAQELRAALHYWCRYARAEIWCEAQGEGWEGWPEERVQAPWEVDSPLRVQVEEDGLRASLGYHPHRLAPVGYYNRGLTLLEADEDTLPGVSFRVEAGALEHTITRDNVLRDGHWELVIQRLRRAEQEQLRPALLEALRAAIQAQDWERHRALLAVCPHVPLPDDEPLLRRAGGGLAALGAVPKRFLGPRRVLWAPGPSPLVEALEQDGHLVLLGPPGERPEFALLHAVYPEVLSEEAPATYLFPRLAPDPPWLASLESTLKRWADQSPRGHTAPPSPGRRERVHAAHFQGGGTQLEGRLILRQRAPGSLEAWDGRPDKGSWLINLDHPLVAEAAGLSPERAGVGLAVAAVRALGSGAPLPADLLDGVAP